MRTTTTVSVELNIGELMALIDYCNTVANNIPTEVYDNPTAAGTTFGETARKYKERADELYELLNEVWPK